MRYKLRIALGLLFIFISLIAMTTGLVIGLSPELFGLMGYGIVDSSLVAFLIGSSVLTSGLISLCAMTTFIIHLSQQKKLAEFVVKDDTKEGK